MLLTTNSTTLLSISAARWILLDFIYLGLHLLFFQIHYSPECGNANGASLHLRHNVECVSLNFKVWRQTFNLWRLSLSILCRKRKVKMSKAMGVSCFKASRIGSVRFEYDSTYISKTLRCDPSRELREIYYTSSLQVCTMYGRQASLKAILFTFNCVNLLFKNPDWVNCEQSYTILWLTFWIAKFQPQILETCQILQLVLIPSSIDSKAGHRQAAETLLNF